MRRARKPQRGSDRISAPATRAASQRNDTAQEPSGLPAVQRAAGNFAIQRQCACGGSSGGCATCAEEEGLSLQTKLTVNEPGDAYEREADSVADRVTAPSYRAAGAPRISHLPASGIGQSAAASETVQQAVSGSGGALDPDVRGEMEQRFGRDFSGVRVHTDPNAVASARALSARAYTVGADIVFDRGHYAPQSSTGKRLLAHELTHVVQQSGAKASAPGKSVQRDWRDDLASDAARDLKAYVENNPKPYGHLLAFFGKISSDIEDNIAAAFVKVIPAETLESFAKDPDGLKVLNVLTQAMITGDVSKFESEQAEKILIAKRSALSVKDYLTQAEQIAELRHEAAPARSVDERADQLARDLSIQVANDLYNHVVIAFNDIPSKIEDNVAAALVATLPDTRLAAIAADPRGMTMLNVFYEAMITGDVSAFEALQSERILLAKAPHISAVKYINTVEEIADLRNKAEDSATDLIIDNIARDFARKMNPHLATRRYAEIRKAIGQIKSDYEDNIASHFVELQTPARLVEIANDPEGSRLLDVLYEAIMTGDVTAFERLQANRIVSAKSQAKPPIVEEALLEDLKYGRVWTLPLRNQKAFRSAYAIFKARLEDGKIRVFYDNYIHFEAADMFKEDLQKLPDAITRQGILLNPDQIVILKLYDQGKKLFPVRAIELIDYANQAMRNSAAVGIQAFEAGLFLGYGGLAAFSGRGVSQVAARVELGELSAARLALSRGVLWADRVAAVLPLISLVVDQNRDWILEQFPEAGPMLLGVLDHVNQVANYYGWGRMGVDVTRALKYRLDLTREAWRQEKAAAGKLTHSQQQAADEIEKSLKAIDDDLARAESTAAQEGQAAGAGKAKGKDPARPGDAPDAPVPTVAHGRPVEHVRLEQPIKIGGEQHTLYMVDGPQGSFFVLCTWCTRVRDVLTDSLKKATAGSLAERRLKEMIEQLTQMEKNIAAGKIPRSAARDTNMLTAMLHMLSEGEHLIDKTLLGGTRVRTSSVNWSQLTDNPAIADRAQELYQKYLDELMAARRPMFRGQDELRELLEKEAKTKALHQARREKVPGALELTPGAEARTAINQAADIPYGFYDRPGFDRFGKRVHAELEKKAPGAKLVLEGSSVTGRRYERLVDFEHTGAPFGSSKMSDYDIAIVSDDLFKAAKDKKIPLGQDITGPGGPRPTPDATRALLPADLKALGLEQLHAEASKAVMEATGLAYPVAFKIRTSSAPGSGPGLEIPR